jgi:hypothetical protein
MSEHAWTIENLAAHVAGGLEAHERERLERHVAECADCGRALDAARNADDRLLSLFATVRPGPTLEDRMIRTFRREQQPMRRQFTPRISPRAVLAAAAVALIAVGGAAITLLVDQEPFAAFATETPRMGMHMQDAREKVAFSPDGRVPLAMGYIVDGSSNTSLWVEDADGRRQEEAKQKALGMESLAQGPPLGRYMKFNESDNSPAQLAKQIREQTRTELEHSFKLRAKVENSDGGLFYDAKTGKELDVDFEYLGTRKADVSVPGTSRIHEKKAPAALRPPNSPPVAMPAVPPAVILGRDGGKLTGDGEGDEKRGDTSKDKEVGKTPPPWQHTAGIDFYFNPQNAFGLGPKGTKEGLNTNQVPGTPGGSAREGRDDPSKRDPSPAFTPPTPPARVESGSKQPEQMPPQVQPEPAPAPAKRYIIRSGEIEFEIDSFDAAVAEIQALVAATKGGYIATINSDKLPNGKVKGAVVVRVPPEQLDTLVLGLRRELGKKGELKGQRIGSQDVSKMYTDLESRLKAARTMEERLLRIIKDGKGEIKDLVLAEKELGVWHTKIEEIEGELRYYGNLISMSTLTINLSEKEIRVAASVAESERVQAGIEVEDVEKAMREVLKAVEEAKGRVTRSEMKQHSAGQFNAVLEFEVMPEAAGPVRDRLRQLGTVARFEVDRVQTAVGGEKLPQDGKLRRGNTKFLVSLYNLVNVTPRETVVLKVNADNVAASYATLRAAVAKANGRVVNADFNEQDRQNISANLTFNVRRDEEAAIQAAVTGAGEVLSRQVSRVAAGETVTDTNVQYRVELIANAAARETVTLKFAAVDVAAAYRAIRDALGKAGARVINASLNEQDRQNITGQLDFDVRRTDEGTVLEAMGKAGDVLTRHVARAADSGNVTDKKVLYKVEFIPATAIEPREVVGMAVEVQDVDGALSVLAAQVKEMQGRIVKGPDAAHEPNGRVTAFVSYDVPLSAAPALAEKLRNSGQVRASRTVPNPQAPEGKLATARFNVTLSNADLLLPRDEGVWAQIRNGLSWSVRGLSMSLNVLIVGIVLVVPWLLLLVAVFWLVRRIWRPVAVAPTGPATPTTPSAAG